MRAVYSLVLFVTATLAACIESAGVPCGDSVCAPGTTCEPTTGRCISDAQRAACDGRAEGDSCSIEGALGACVGGACATFSCGDGRREGTERCDGDDLGGATCESVGYHGATTGLACTSDCLFDVTGCERTCGDGIADPEEQCDGSDLGTAADCTSLGFYEPAGLTCAQSCIWDFHACQGSCGDGMLNGPELCDGNPPTDSCVDFGFDAGPAGCSASCGISYAQCARLSWKSEQSGRTSISAMHATAGDEWIGDLTGNIARRVGGVWQETPSHVTTGIDAIWSEGDRAWAVTTASAGDLLVWDGADWSAAAGAPAVKFVDVWGTGGTAFVMSRDAGVFAWDGSGWTTVGALACTQGVRIRGASATDLWAGCSTGLFHYDGTIWTLVRPGLTHDITMIDAETVVHSVLVSTGEQVEVLAHGTWRVTPLTITCQHLAATAANHIWCGTGGGHVLHFDGVRVAYVDLIAGTTSPVVAVSAVGPVEVVAGTIDGNIYRNRGSVLASPDALALGASAMALSVDAGDERFVVTRLGDVASYRNDLIGTGISTAPLQSPDQAGTIWAASARDLWVGTFGGALYHYDGLSWTRSAETYGPIETIVGTGATDAWMFTGIAPWLVYHFDGAGWTPLPDSVGRSMAVATASRPNEVWAAATAPSTLYHWTGAWSAVHEFPDTISSISAPQNDAVWVTTGIRGVYALDAGVWREVLVPSVLPITHVVAFATDDVFVASTQELLHFDGMTWSPVRLSLDNLEEIVDVQGRRGRLEILSDSPLNGFRVRSLLRFAPWVCRASEVDCTDEVDDDCDGMIDGTDADCP